MEAKIIKYIENLPRGKITNDLECIICKESFDIEKQDYRELNCSEKCTQRIYHENCIIEWIKINPTKNSKCCYCQNSFNIPIIIEKINNISLINKIDKNLTLKNIFCLIFYIVIDLFFMVNLPKINNTNNILFNIFLFSLSGTFLHINITEFIKIMNECQNKKLIVAKSILSSIIDIIHFIFMYIYFFNYNNHIKNYEYFGVIIFTLCPLSLVSNIFNLFKYLNI